MQVASFLQKTAQNPVKEKMWVDSVFSLNSYRKYYEIYRWRSRKQPQNPIAKS